MKKYIVIILVLIISQNEIFSQKLVKDLFYNEFGFGVSGNHILGDWLEQHKFNNVARLEGVGVSAIHRMQLKKKRISIKNSFTINRSSSRFTMDFMKISSEYKVDATKKSSLFSNTYTVMVGTQGELNLLNYDIFHKEEINKWTPYLGLGLGGVFYHSSLGTDLAPKLSYYDNVPDIIKDEDFNSNKIGGTFYVNMSLGIKANITPRNIITLQLGYYYFHSDNIDWLERGSRNDYLQELQIGYTYIW